MKSATTMESTSMIEPAMVPAVVPAFEVGGTTVEILIAVGIIAIAVRTVIVVVVLMVFLSLSGCVASTVFRTNGMFYGSAEVAD